MKHCVKCDILITHNLSDSGLCVACSTPKYTGPNGLRKCLEKFRKVVGYKGKDKVGGFRDGDPVCITEYDESLWWCRNEDNFLPVSLGRILDPDIEWRPYPEEEEVKECGCEACQLYTELYSAITTDCAGDMYKSVLFLLKDKCGHHED